ncbi:hypothetical protein R6Q59_023063 [Mikania micrantha]
MTRQLNQSSSLIYEPIQTTLFLPQISGRRRHNHAHFVFAATDLGFLNLPSLDLIYSSYKSKMAGAPPGTAKMIIKEIAIASVLGYICASAWKYTYHRDLTKRTKSFYNMLDKGEITVVVLDD